MIPLQKKRSALRHGDELAARHGEGDELVYTWCENSVSETGLQTSLNIFNHLHRTPPDTTGHVSPRPPQSAECSANGLAIGFLVHQQVSWHTMVSKGPSGGWESLCWSIWKQNCNRTVETRIEMNWTVCFGCDTQQYTKYTCGSVSKPCTPGEHHWTSK